MHSQKILLAVFIPVLLLSGCSNPNKVEMRFLNHWPDKDAQPELLWAASGNLFSQSALESKEYETLSQEKVFGNHIVMLLKGTLPLGEIDIHVIHLKGDLRETALIDPSDFTNEDPVANFHAYEIRGLTSEMMLSYAKYQIDAGRYYIFLEHNNVEIAGTTLEITQ